MQSKVAFLEGLHALLLGSNWVVGILATAPLNASWKHCDSVVFHSVFRLEIPLKVLMVVRLFFYYVFVHRFWQVIKWEPEQGDSKVK